MRFYAPRKPPPRLPPPDEPVLIGQLAAALGLKTDTLRRKLRALGVMKERYITLNDCLAVTLTASKAAHLCGVSAGTVRRWCKAGRIAAVERQPGEETRLGFSVREVLLVRRYMSARIGSRA